MMTQAGVFLAIMNILNSKPRPVFGFLGMLVNNELFSLRLDSSLLLLTILRCFFYPKTHLIDLKDFPALVVNLTERY